MCIAVGCSPRSRIAAVLDWQRWVMHACVRCTGTQIRYPSRYIQHIHASIWLPHSKTCHDISVFFFSFVVVDVRLYLCARCSLCVCGAVFFFILSKNRCVAFVCLATRTKRYHDIWQACQFFGHAGMVEAESMTGTNIVCGTYKLICRMSIMLRHSFTIEYDLATHEPNSLPIWFPLSSEHVL